MEKQNERIFNYPIHSGGRFCPLCQVGKLINEGSYDIRLGLDGGINTANIYETEKAGADMFVTCSAIFKQPNYKTVIEMRFELAKIFPPSVTDVNH